MFHPWMVVLALLLSLLVNVDAGHLAWETSRVQHPQWVALQFHPERFRLWPNKKIRYAFADTSNRIGLRAFTRAAHQRWLASGLPDEFQIEEISIEECERDRAACLWIERAEQPVLNTPLGLPNRKPDGTFYVAHWSISTEIGLFQPSPNIAHELGHAWGLIHEMQHKTYWWDEGDTYNPTKFFEYKCEKVYDFEEVTQHLSHEQIWDPRQGVCTEAGHANHYGFKGSAWEPYLVFQQYSHISAWPTIDDVDWDSIMMYPSYVGVKEGGQDNHDFNNAVILKSANVLPADRWMGRNFNPSPLDVEGIKLLYNHHWPVPAPILYGSSHSPNYAAFRQFAPGCNA